MSTSQQAVIPPMPSDFVLPPGWVMEELEVYSGVSKGKKRKAFLGPDGGAKLSSLPAVWRYLHMPKVDYPRRNAGTWECQVCKLYNMPDYIVCVKCCTPVASVASLLPRTTPRTTPHASVSSVDTPVPSVVSPGAPVPSVASVDTPVPSVPEAILVVKVEEEEGTVYPQPTEAPTEPPTEAPTEPPTEPPMDPVERHLTVERHLPVDRHRLTRERLHFLNVPPFEVVSGEDAVHTALVYMQELHSRFTWTSQRYPQMENLSMPPSCMAKFERAYRSLPLGISFRLFLFLFPFACELEVFEPRDLGDLQVPFLLASVPEVQSKRIRLRY